MSNPEATPFRTLLSMLAATLQIPGLPVLLRQHWRIFPKLRKGHSFQIRPCESLRRTAELCKFRSHMKASSAQQAQHDNPPIPLRAEGLKSAPPDTVCALRVPLQLEIAMPPARPQVALLIFVLPLRLGSSGSIPPRAEPCSPESLLMLGPIHDAQPLPIGNDWFPILLPVVDVLVAQHPTNAEACRLHDEMLRPPWSISPAQTPLE
mmetsp:Transcript_12634/g.34922  ORF Transcript_12634/g.34922 Transcript_12634/m.34922 type:complete len:207 (+) Transcript_12634:803-1423(+)